MADPGRAEVSWAMPQLAGGAGVSWWAPGWSQEQGRERRSELHGGDSSQLLPAQAAWVVVSTPSPGTGKQIWDRVRSDQDDPFRPGVSALSIRKGWNVKLKVASGYTRRTREVVMAVNAKI